MASHLPGTGHDFFSSRLWSSGQKPMSSSHTLNSRGPGGRGGFKALRGAAQPRPHSWCQQSWEMPQPPAMSGEGSRDSKCFSWNHVFVPTISGHKVNAGGSSQFAASWPELSLSFPPALGPCWAGSGERDITDRVRTQKPPSVHTEKLGSSGRKCRAAAERQEAGLHRNVEPTPILRINKQQLQGTWQGTFQQRTTQHTSHVLSTGCAKGQRCTER